MNEIIVALITGGVTLAGGAGQQPEGPGRHRHQTGGTDPGGQGA